MGKSPCALLGVVVLFVLVLCGFGFQNAAQVESADADVIQEIKQQVIFPCYRYIISRHNLKNFPFSLEAFYEYMKATNQATQDAERKLLTLLKQAPLAQEIFFTKGLVACKQGVSEKFSSVENFFGENVMGKEGSLVPELGFQGLLSETGFAARRELVPEKSKAVQGKSRRGVGLKRSFPPVYPRIAKKENWEGEVILRVVVRPNGRPERPITVKRSSGHPVLDEAAIDAVKRWTFHPAKDGNIPVRSAVEIPIKFSLKNVGSVG